MRRQTHFYAEVHTRPSAPHVGPCPALRQRRGGDPLVSRAIGCDVDSGPITLRAYSDRFRRRDEAAALIDELFVPHGA